VLISPSGAEAYISAAGDIAEVGSSTVSALNAASGSPKWAARFWGGKAAVPTSAAISSSGDRLIVSNVVVDVPAAPTRDLDVVMTAYALKQ
jgi:hypothetical protein